MTIFSHTQIDERFVHHNSHLTNPNDFAERDPQLRKLRDQPLVFRSGLLDQFPKSEPGIYTLGGGRQVGKTTLLKQVAKYDNGKILCRSDAGSGGAIHGVAVEPLALALLRLAGPGWPKP